MSYQYLLDTLEGSSRDSKMLDHVLRAIELYTHDHNRFKVDGIDNGNDRNELEQVLKVYVLRLAKQIA